MNHSSPLLSRDQIRKAFRLLGERLQRRGVVADIYVVGGAAMALAYDSRRATRDIDAIFEPHGIVLQEAREVAIQLGLPPWWLNDQASVYVATNDDEFAPTVFDHPGLRVLAASGEHLLAMKVLAGRRRDAEDIKVLADYLNLQTVSEVLALCETVFPDEPVPERVRLLLADVLRPVPTTNPVRLPLS